jgi:hypothetical protein
MRIISSERAPYTLKYIEKEGQFVINNYLLDTNNNSIKHCLILRQFPKRCSSQHDTISYIALLNFCNFSIRISSVVYENSNIVDYLDLMNSLQVEKKYVMSMLDKIKQESQFLVDEYVAFFRGLLQWSEEKTLIMLENPYYHLRDDMEDCGSWFHHEPVLYWAIYSLFREIKGLDDFWFTDASIVDKLINIILGNQKTCKSFDSDDWSRIRKLFADELYSQQPTLKNIF